MEYLIHNIPPCPVFSFNPLPSSTSIFQVVWSACIYMQLGKDREGVKRDPRTMETLRGITAYPYTVSLSLSFSFFSFAISLLRLRLGLTLHDLGKCRGCCRVGRPHTSQKGGKQREKERKGWRRSARVYCTLILRAPFQFRVRFIIGKGGGGHERSVEHW